ncbi:hypothetical protein P8452_70620 [Trifolium repens]|nr:hypothetical protein P8452_70620 [Trifolium repens]
MQKTATVFGPDMRDGSLSDWAYQQNQLHHYFPCYYCSFVAPKSEKQKNTLLDTPNLKAFENFPLILLPLMDLVCIIYSVWVY